MNCFDYFNKKIDFCSENKFEELTSFFFLKIQSYLVYEK